jgi:hypothetical protein
MKGKKKRVTDYKLTTFSRHVPPIKKKGHGGEPNETVKAHFPPLEDATRAVQNTSRLPHPNISLHLKIIN